ncbi:MAG TPA: patatin-like phospholipase family protein [Anaerolineae bacterium]|nr:patatin-like phospholipase family protein [Anaerolineae bacterium]HQH38464.1 patatin-like phospholipase family protein [Anaerolineae bacterium]
MKKCVTLVLGGGGARGALQVGAIRALLEAGFQPDLLVGTSIGAANATGLALWGVNQAGLAAVEQTYQKMAASNLMDPRLARLTLRLLSGRPNHHGSRRVAEFFIAAGITPDLRFGQLNHVRLGLVGADLTSGRPVIYGRDPEQSVLEGLLASIALPPWFAPVEDNGQYIVDGGALSNLPIEPALSMGATEIIALDLDDPNTTAESSPGLNPLLGKLAFAVSRRYVQLETALAEARGVPVQRIELRSPTATPIWDFQNYQQLIQIGYETAVHNISEWAKPTAG